jgi:hypothetical protein
VIVLPLSPVGHLLNDPCNQNPPRPELRITRFQENPDSLVLKYQGASNIRAQHLGPTGSKT